MITREQIKAARAMLDWSQKVLAEKCGDISEPTVKLLEAGKVHSTENTLGIIRKTLEGAGIEFIPQGVRFRDDVLTILEPADENDNLFLKILDDVYYTLRGTNGELLYSFVDNSASPPEVTDRELMIRRDGITMRSLVRYGDSYLVYPLDEYRYLPKGYYINNPTLVYGNKFAVALQDIATRRIRKAVIIKDNAVADLKKKEFEIIWSYGEKPVKTEAKKAYA